MKINKKQTTSTILNNNPNATTNKEGELAFSFKPHEALINLCLTRMFGEPKFYNNQDDSTEHEEFSNAIKAVAKTDPEFVMQTATYARNVMNLRTTPIAMLVESANLPEFKGTGLIRKYLPNIVKRADEITEVLAYQFTYFKDNLVDENGVTLRTKATPNQLLRGLKDTFGNFSEYQFAKYNRKGLVTLKDALKLSHPKPKNDSQKEVFKRILTGSLKTPKTWETVLSSWKTNGFKSKTEAWESIIDTWTANGKVLNYMAMLRNVNNILKENVDLEHVEKVCLALTNENAILNSKQFPFRFYSAHKILSQSDNKYTSKLLDAIETAMEISVENIPKISGFTFMSADNSGSMEWTLTKNSTIKCLDIANLMQALAVKICETSQTSVFAQLFKVVNTTKKSNIIDSSNKFKHTEVGGSTNGYLIMKHLLSKQQKVDRILVFTDCQLYDNNVDYGYEESFATLFLKYRATINPNVKLYMFDLAGYGNTVIPTETKNAVFISGWSEKVLEFINLFELGNIKLINEIKNYNPKVNHPPLPEGA